MLCCRFLLWSQSLVILLYAALSKAGFQIALSFVFSTNCNSKLIKRSILTTLAYIITQHLFCSCITFVSGFLKLLLILVVSEILLHYPIGSRYLCQPLNMSQLACTIVWIFIGQFSNEDNILMVTVPGHLFLLFFLI